MIFPSSLGKQETRRKIAFSGLKCLQMPWRNAKPSLVSTIPVLFSLVLILQDKLRSSHTWRQLESPSLLNKGQRTEKCCMHCTHSRWAVSLLHVNVILDFDTWLPSSRVSLFKDLGKTEILLEHRRCGRGGFFFEGCSETTFNFYVCLLKYWSQSNTGKKEIQNSKKFKF